MLTVQELRWALFHLPQDATVLIGVGADLMGVQGAIKAERWLAGATPECVVLAAQELGDDGHPLNQGVDVTPLEGDDAQAVIDAATKG